MLRWAPGVPVGVSGCWGPEVLPEVPGAHMALWASDLLPKEGCSVPRWLQACQPLLLFRGCEQPSKAPHIQFFGELNN